MADKVIILAMSCNKDFFIQEEELVRNTWSKELLNNKYPNISFYFLRSDKNERIEGNYIYVNTGDGFYETFQKNKRAFELINENLEYDYILRTNLSTYINIDLLETILHTFILKHNYIYTSQLYKKNGFLYGMGNFLLFNKSHINKILNSNIEINKEFADDIIFGQIFSDEENIYREIKPICIFPNVYNYLYIRGINSLNINNDLVISYRYYTDFNLQEDYVKRKELEFDACKKIYDTLRNQKIDIKINNLINILSYRTSIIFNHDNRQYELI